MAISTVAGRLTILILALLAIGPASATVSAQQGEPESGAAPATNPETGPPSGAPEVRLRSVATGLAAPTRIVEPDDGSGRRFITDQTGEIWILDAEDNLATEPFLDLSEQIIEIDEHYDERGLLGLAFHPSYADNGRFFVYYSAPLGDGAPDGWDHTSHVSEFRVDPDDPDRADPDSERIVMEIDQPFHNHNAGQILFGQDGFLYIPLGDGGNGGDVDPDDDQRGRPEEGHGQALSTLLGSILRIDIDGNEPYEVPADNPFTDREGEDEIYAYGFRNPYGLSIDRETGDFYAAEAGQALYEEVNRISEPGGNYGWNIKEGTICFDPEDFGRPLDDCPDTGQRGEPLIDPIVAYQRSPDAGSVIVPAVRYRGSQLEGFDGALFFGDYSRVRFIPQGVLYVAREPADGEGTWEHEELRVAGDAANVSDGVLNAFMLGFDQDLEGELYALTTREGGPTGDTGEVFEVVAATTREGSGDAAVEGEVRADDDGLPWGAWVVAGVAILVLVVGILVAVGRRRAGQGGDVR